VVAQSTAASGEPPAAAHQAAGTSESEEPPPPPPTRRRDRLLWLWPVLGIAAISTVGEQWGGYGALVTAVVLMAALILSVGDNDVLDRRMRLGTAASAVVVATLLVFGHQSGWTYLSSTPVERVRGDARATPSSPMPAPTDFRGARLTQEQIRGRSLHGAMLAGAVLDGLDLRGVDLIDAVAPVPRSPEPGWTRPT